jgi:hypothetical protein
MKMLERQLKHSNAERWNDEIIYKTQEHQLRLSNAEHWKDEKTR